MWRRRSGGLAMTRSWWITSHKMKRFLNIDTFRHIIENAPYTASRWSWLMKHVFLVSCKLSVQERFFKVSNVFFWKYKQRVVTKHVLHHHYVQFVDHRPCPSWYKLERRVQTRSYCSLCEELWNVSVTKPRCFISECRINKRYFGLPLRPTAECYWNCLFGFARGQRSRLSYKPFVKCVSEITKRWLLAWF